MVDFVPVLACEGVSAGYIDAQGRPHELLRDVTFALRDAELLVVLGRSGSGKSTLLRLLNRFDDPLRGTVRYRGKDLTEWDPLALRRRVALVLQTPVVFEGSVRDNLLTRPPGETIEESTLLRALDDVDLDREMLDTTARELSVGEQQRVCLARALLGDPDALLLDEPTAALDPHTSSRIATLVESLRSARGLTTVVVTHDAALVGRLSGTLALLHGGRVDVRPGDDDVQRFLAGQQEAAS